MCMCTKSVEATVWHHDCKWNVSLPPPIEMKAITRRSSPGEGERGYLKVLIQAPSQLFLKCASLSWKPPLITVGGKGMEMLLQARSHSQSLFALILRLILIHLSVNTGRYHWKMQFSYGGGETVPLPSCSWNVSSAAYRVGLALSAAADQVSVACVKLISWELWISLSQHISALAFKG